MVKRSERVFLGYVTEMLCMTKIGLERHRLGIRQMLYFLKANKEYVVAAKITLGCIHF